MRLGILGWDHTEHESVQLVHVAQDMGHAATLFTLDDVICRDGQGGVDVRVRGCRAASFDVIISRAQLRAVQWQPDLERLTLLSNLDGVPILDPAAPFAAAESKLIGMQRLARAGVPVPPTVSCSSPDDVQDAIRRWGRIVVKPSFGFGGEDVERLDGDAGVTAPLLRRHGALLAQPYLPHPEGDMRLTVVGDDVGFSFRRIPQNGGWKANVAMGARAASFDPPDDLRELALRAARALDITIAGVDIIRHGDGYVVLEINNVPGWHSLPPAHQVEAARRVIDWAIRRTRCAV